MPLSVGDKLGPYEIVAPIGAGGMGEVYRATDPRMGRDVAIKISAERFSDRFSREVHAVAALNHPNICHLYDVGPDYLVMELIEGPTLAERIKEGAIPLEESLKVAQQIIAALEAAHEKGIVHRDLKPGNIKLRPDGTVKVLDFGLAKVTESAEPGSRSEHSPTVTLDAATRAGVILGTAAYMPPEQARGKSVDKRADIWAFGVVLYEMLTGERLFEGETVSDTLIEVATKEPNWDRVPAKAQRLLRRCLEKDPKRRLRDIGDAWAYVEKDVNDDVDRPAESEPASPAKLRWIPWGIAALAIIIAGAIAWEWLHVPAPPPRSVTRSSWIILSPHADLPALSRDGTRLAYVVNEGGQPRLMLRMMDQLEGKPIPGLEHGVLPEFSPDGQWIAYISYPAPFKLKKIQATGGASITLCDMAAPNRLSWGVHDTIVFGSPKGLMRVPAAGGTPQSLTTVDTKNGESSHSYPEFLPGGQAILFTIDTGPSLSTTGIGPSGDASRIAVLDLKTGTTRVLVTGGYAGRYVPTGHLVYLRGGTLFAVPFDLKRLAVTGWETPVVEGVSFSNFAFSDSSLLVFGLGDSEAANATTLEWTDRKGVAQPLPEPPHTWGTFALSPDGKLIAGYIVDNVGASGPSHSDIWIYDVERRTLSRLTFEGSNGRPIWTPDGKWVTFYSRRAQQSGIYRIAADKSGQPELLLATDATAYPQSWTPDGKTLLYNQRKEAKYQTWIFPAPGAGGENKPRLFSRASFNEWNARISPDGKWVVYDSDESGKPEVYVVPFPGPGAKTQISTQGGMLPWWSRNGRELFFREPSTNQLMTVDVAAGPVFRAGHPQALFKLSGPTPTPTQGAWFDVTPDPKRFLVERMPPEAAATATFAIVTDWFEDLRRRVPVKP